MNDGGGASNVGGTRTIRISTTMGEASFHASILYDASSLEPVWPIAIVISDHRLSAIRVVTMQAAQRQA